MRYIAQKPRKHEDISKDPSLSHIFSTPGNIHRGKKVKLDHDFVILSTQQ